MALYTLKSREEALNPLASYGGSSRWVRNQMASLGYGPSVDETQVYNAIGRTAGEAETTNDGGGDNFFTKRGKSIENALGTTGAAIASGVYDAAENAKTEQLLKDNKTRMNDIAKKYGYNTYHDVWDARDKAEAEGDTATLDLIDNTINPQLKSQANENAKKADEKAAAYKDYRENNYVSKKVNQDRGKFAGSAINTLSTAVDVTGLGANPLSNAIQGGVEGIADELEQNGLENFDWQRAGQNALIGATTGAVTGALNKGVSGALAKRAAAKGLTNTVAKAGAGNAIKNGAKTLATGAARGALSGAVGGATGAGLQSALAGQDIGQGISNALQGAVQGAQQGAVTGGIMAGANAAFGRTNFGKQLQNAKTNWDQSGSNFDERLTNTLTSGDSAVGDWLMGKRQSNVLGAAGNIGNTNTPTTAKGWLKQAGQRAVEDINNTNFGNRIVDLNGQRVDTDNMSLDELNSYRDQLRVAAENADTPESSRQYKLQAADISEDISKRLNAVGAEEFRQDFAKKLDNYSAGKSNANMPEDIRNMQVNQNGMLGYEDDGTTPVTVEEALARAGANRNGSQRTQTATLVAQDPWDRVAQQAGYNNYDEVLQRYAEANPNAKINPRGMAGQVLTWMDQNPNTPTTAGGWAKRAGQRAVEDINNSNLGLRVKDTATEDPSKRLYNALVGNQEPVATAKTNTLPETDMGIEEATAKTSKAGKLRNAAGLKYAAQYGTIDKPTAKATNPAKTFTELAELGFTKPADVERMAGAMTGSNGEMSALVRNMVNAANPVDTFAGEKSGQTLDDYINLSIQKHGLDGIREGKAVKSQIDALMGSLPSHAEGSIDFQDTPEAVFKLTQQLDAEAANYRGKSGMNYGTTTPDKLRAAQVISDVSGLLKDRIYSNSDVKQALTPEVAQNLKSYAPNNKAWAKYVDETVMNMENVKDLRSAQANWVNANKIIDNAYVNSMTYGGRVSGSGSIPLTKRGLAGAILDKTINSDTGLRAQAKLLNKAADFVDQAPDNNAATNPDTAAGWAKQAGRRAAEDLGNTNLGNRIQDVSGTEVVNPQIASPAELATMTDNYNPSTQLYNAIGRTEGSINAEQSRTANYLANAAQEAEIVPSTSNANMANGYTAPTASTTSTALYDNLAGTPTAAASQATTSGRTSTGYFQPSGDQWTDIIASALSSAIDANDVEAFAALYGMYQDAISNASKAASKEKDYSNPTDWNSSDRTKLLSAQNAMDQIDQLESAYNNATGGNGGNAIQGWLRSRAADISGGNLDPSASNYNNMAQSIGMGIVKNLINLGVTEADAQRYLQYLPALTDTKEQAAQKLDTLRNIYQSQINNLYSAYGA